MAGGPRWPRAQRLPRRPRGENAPPRSCRPCCATPPSRNGRRTPRWSSTTSSARNGGKAPRPSLPKPRSNPCGPGTAQAVQALRRLGCQGPPRHFRYRCQAMRQVRRHRAGSAPGRPDSAGSPVNAGGGRGRSRAPQLLAGRAGRRRVRGRGRQALRAARRLAVPMNGGRAPADQDLRARPQPPRRGLQPRRSTDPHTRKERRVL